ncbi:uncharacterized protein LOC135500153 [Lineus longissimus]|uniref:uncharacterized protein LOC135500153 n=1 Tax=Lineus longissimus TaxID=88925 RepID=UPI00315C4C5D
MAKARVVPLKPVTIPRLELQAAVVSIRISDLLNRELDIPNITNVYWTDSKVVLGYLQDEARKFHIYVANRVQRIKESSDSSQWNYVRTEENPADFTSRGLAAQELQITNWFRGPTFLLEKEIPNTADVTAPITLSPSDPEVKRVKTLQTKSQAVTSLLDRFGKFSSWSKLLAAIEALQAKCIRKLGEPSLSLQESRSRAERLVVRNMQCQYFEDEIKDLKGKR